MTRSIFVLTIALAVVVPALGSGGLAYAEEPTPAQLEKAKKAFVEGKKAFDAGDFPEAAQKFKESYNLSKKPALLYNIGLANESAAQDDIALFYYRKFLSDAPADSPQRAEVTDRVKTLEKKFQTGPATTGPTTTGPTTTEPAHTGPIVIKPAGTYSATDFQHQVTDVAPPAKPLDVTAFVPEDSGWTVTLFFRTAGEGKFASKPMKWRYKELVARIPPTKMIGNSVQYYIEVKDQAGAVVTRSGKSTSPNLVNLEAGATPKFYPDFSEDGTVQTPQETTADDTEEDPLHPGQKKPKKQVSLQTHDTEGLEVQPQPTDLGGNGFRDVGSSKFKYVKWGSTGVAATMVGLSVLFYVQAGNYATALEDEAGNCAAGQCPLFDSYSQDLESAGKLRQTLSRVTLGVGVGAGIVAGYYWYKELRAKKRGELKVSGKSASPEAASWVVAPTVGDGFAGAAAAARF